ncbi:MAG: thioredoxin family protein [Hyphomicrobiales bacterium]|nr:thioredoxin family protein [Hyphomicrobiales bacterium]MCP5371952.1 thioredoxin family protein [Hyphomicrobiales bacterium]
MSRYVPFLCLLAALLAAAAAAGPARAASSDWVVTDHTRLRLVSAVDRVGEGDTLPLGLHFRLKDGWKIYWRSPGDAGYPPRLDLAGSSNVASAEIAWPLPERFEILGFHSMGYKHEVVLPVTARLEKGGAAVRLRVNVDYLTCADICVPYQADLALDLAAGSAPPPEEAHLIGRYASQVPRRGAGLGLAVTGAETVGTAADGGVLLRVAVRSDTPLAGPDVFVEGAPELAFANLDRRVGAGGTTAHLDLSVLGLEDIPGGRLEGQELTVTLADGGRAIEQAVTVTAGRPAAANGLSLAAVLALAVLGGLILNLMPCVLPVLSIKLLGVIGHGGGRARTVRLSFLTSAAGILFSFLALAGVLVALKAGGAAVGWGIQFQHPWFLTAMTLVVALFACNLWGFFEVRLPGWIADAGESAGHVHGLGGHFLTGAFATLLATPCSAPFLGTAIGFAFSRGTAEILAVFAALGLGLAVPYLVVAAVPGLATRLPRPGMWMVRLRQVLGFALAATALWLITVLATQAGKPAAGAIGALAIAIGAVLYLRHRRPVAGPVALGALAVLAAAAFAVPSVMAPPAPQPGAAAARAAKADFWVPFDEAAIDGLVAAGKVVFVDVTADWCITCQVNKAVVLGRGEVRDRLGGGTVTPMQADWTRPDPAIAAYLASFGRYGIPFNAVYGPGAPRGLPLPELLTPGAVLDALDRAGASKTAAR